MEEETIRRSQKAAGNSRSPFRSENSRSPFAETTRLPARARGARLFRVRRPDGVCRWDVELILNGTLVRRSFENELHARAWLVAATQPLLPQDSLDLEELNAPFRAACVGLGVCVSSP